MPHRSLLHTARDGRTEGAQWCAVRSATGSALYGESVGLGNGRLDMVSVIEAIEARTEAIDPATARLPHQDTTP
ncbi:hypothetical protein ACFV1F_22280 [Streptomyces sp. NPDC059590]|uniref:hypothetical protein n=1 Tax=unclassified Streptomyces TaxID=2593676 RepID=UPI0036826B95